MVSGCYRHCASALPHQKNTHRKRKRKYFSRTCAIASRFYMIKTLIRRTNSPHYYRGHYARIEMGSRVASRFYQTELLSGAAKWWLPTAARIPLPKAALPAMLPASAMILQISRYFFWNESHCRFREYFLANGRTPASSRSHRSSRHGTSPGQKWQGNFIYVWWGWILMLARYLRYCRYVKQTAFEGLDGCWF